MTDRSAGVVGNERLTALTGGVVLVLSVAEIATVPTLGSLIAAHFFLGMLLAGPVVAKTASTGWRFIRYYSRDPNYRRKGPPRLLLRVMAPVLVVSTLVLIGSGIALAITGPAPEILVRVHVVSFLFWLATLAVHVFAYVKRVPGLIADDWRRRTGRQKPGLVQQKRGTPDPRGRRMRLAVNIAALAVAALAGLLLLPTAAPWDGWRGQAVTGPGVLAVAVCVGTALAVMIKRR